MSRFFVGQRVRLARPENPANLGATGRITQLGHWPVGSVGLSGRKCLANFDCYIDWDCPVVATLFGTKEDKAHASQHQLEPILPEGHKPCEEQFKRDLDRLLEREGVSA